MIAIVDYRAGNLASVARALDFLGYRHTVTDRADVLAKAERIILPGVGAAGAAMENLRQLGLDRALRREIIESGKPFLGICIGIQILLEASEEDNATCLGIIQGKAVRFPTTINGRKLKVPQIGWNRVRLIREHPLFKGIGDGNYFYFVNSYYPKPHDPQLVLATAEYGVEFCAALAWQNVMATQFHVEKSGEAGLEVLNNFCRW